MQLLPRASTRVCGLVWPAPPCCWGGCFYPGRHTSGQKGLLEGRPAVVWHGWAWGVPVFPLWQGITHILGGSCPWHLTCTQRSCTSLWETSKFGLTHTHWLGSSTVLDKNYIFLHGTSYCFSSYREVAVLRFRNTWLINMLSVLSSPRAQTSTFFLSWQIPSEVVFFLFWAAPHRNPFSGTVSITVPGIPRHQCFPLSIELIETPPGPMLSELCPFPALTAPGRRLHFHAAPRCPRLLHTLRAFPSHLCLAIVACWWPSPARFSRHSLNATLSVEWFLPSLNSHLVLPALCSRELWLLPLVSDFSVFSQYQHTTDPPKYLLGNMNEWNLIKRVLGEYPFGIHIYLKLKVPFSLEVALYGHFYCLSSLADPSLKSPPALANFFALLHIKLSSPLV